MSGGQDVLGMVAGGASLLSLSVQLAESAATLKGLYHDTRNAPEALNHLAHEIETVSLDLKLIERKGQSEACGASLLNQCLENCQMHAEEIQQLTDQLSLKLGEVFLSGMVDTLVREQVIDTLLNDLDHAQNVLQQDVLEFHRQERDRRWRLRAAGGAQPHRGHQYSDIAVRENARAHFGDVYITNYGPPSQETVTDLQIYSSTLQKQPGEPQRPMRERKSGPHWGDQRSTAMQRTIQTYTDELRREFGQVVQRAQASLIQELEEVSPRLISSNQLEKSDEIASDSAGRRRSRNPRNIAFRLRLKVPAWFSTRVWEIAKVDAQQGQGWDLCFRTFNRRPNDSEVFKCCRHGELHGLKKLIQAGEASLFDVDESGGNLFAVSRPFLFTGDLGLIRWLSEQNLQIEREVLYKYLISGFGKSVYYAANTECEETLRIFVHDLDDFEDMDLPGFARIWQRCGSPAGLKLLLQKFGTFVQAMSVVERVQFYSASLSPRESAACYMAKIDLCCEISSPESFYRNMGASVLHHVVRVFGKDYPDSDWEGWTRIGVTAIQNGTDLLALKRYTRRGVSCPHTPLGYLLWSIPSDSSTEAISTALERWTHMLDEAKVDLTAYYARESDNGTLSHTNANLISHTSRNTVVRLISRYDRSEKICSHANLNLIPCTSRHTVVNLATLDYDPLTKVCNFRIRHQTAIPLMRLNHLPGSFPGPVEIPVTICWHPNHEELQEGYWSRSGSGGPVLRGRMMNLQELDRMCDGSYLGLVDSTQDDTGSLMRMIDMSHCSHRSRKRASSEPAPLHRKRYDYERLRFSKVHPWLPPIHFCTFRTTWVFSGHSFGSFVDARSCVKGHGRVDKEIPASYRGFLSEMRECQDGLSSGINEVVLHDGTPDCHRGCGKIDFSTISRPPTLPCWHPGFCE